MSNEKIVFATHAFWRDYEVVLAPGRFRAIVESHRYDFSERIVVLNNFRDAKEAAKARRMADELVACGAATRVIDVHRYLEDEVLRELGFDPKTYWQRNPYFSSAQLAAWHWSRSRATHILHMNGDVWLERSMAWIPRALEKLAEHPDMIGFNLTRNIYAPLYSEWAATPPNSVDEAFWVCRDWTTGWGLSDHAFFVRLVPDLTFGMDEAEIARWAYRFPPYAIPCFEMCASNTFIKAGMSYGALRPHPGLAPTTRHKNFPKSRLKFILYRLLGKYRRGHFLTPE